MESAAFQFIGNRSVVERLEAKLRGGRLPHALIFSGPLGVGKHTCARWFAQALNCAAPNPMACQVCAACTRIAGGTFPDVAILAPEADSSQIKVEQIRGMRSLMSLEPLEGRASVQIIDPAEAMTPSAANALLKSLEEPPSTVYFFLITTNAQELLPTIRSRSQTYHFSPSTLDEVRRTGVTDELTLRWSEGSVGRALAADPIELGRSRDQMLGFVEQALLEKQDALGELIAAGGDLARDKEGYEDRIRMVVVLIRDILLLREGFPDRLVNVDVRGRIQRLAEATGTSRLIQISETLKFIEINLKYHLNRQLMTDNLILAMLPASSEILDDKMFRSR